VVLRVQFPGNVNAVITFNLVAMILICLILSKVRMIHVVSMNNSCLMS